MGIFPRTKPGMNCLTCFYYRPDDVVDYVGNCIRNAPKGQGNVALMASPSMEFASIIEPGIIWCGDWKKWRGAARPCGTPPQSLQALKEIDSGLALIDLQAKTANDAAQIEAKRTKKAAVLVSDKEIGSRKETLLRQREALIDKILSEISDEKQKAKILSFYAPHRLQEKGV